MNPAVGIRPATAGDLDAVECVERRSFPEGEAFTRRQLRYLLTHAQGASYAATRDGAVVGYISLLMRRTAQNLRIYSVAVDPAARGCGAGQALLDAAIALARRLGLREVTLEVRTDNDSAIRLYAPQRLPPRKTAARLLPRRHGRTADVVQDLLASRIASQFASAHFHSPKIFGGDSAPLRKTFHPRREPRRISRPGIIPSVSSIRSVTVSMRCEMSPSVRWISLKRITPLAFNVSNTSIDHLSPRRHSTSRTGQEPVGVKFFQFFLRLHPFGIQQWLHACNHLIFKCIIAFTGCLPYLCTQR